MSIYKVTHLLCMQGTSRVSKFPRKGTRVEAGRWIVYDMEKHKTPIIPAHAISDHDTFEEAAKECRRLYSASRDQPALANSP